MSGSLSTGHFPVSASGRRRLLMMMVMVRGNLMGMVMVVMMHRRRSLRIGGNGRHCDGDER